MQTDRDIPARTGRLALAALLVIGALAGCAASDPRVHLRDGGSGGIAFATQTPTGGQFIRGSAAPSAVISGDLRLPRTSGGRVPAVVLIHGSSGVGNNMKVWQAELDKIGVATFVVDSFTGRGVRETATDQSRLATAAMVVDAYRALALLATHPAIDPERIAVMGFSKGGTVSTAASMERFHRMWGADGLRFRAYLPFYPWCGVQLFGETEVKSPMRIFHGAADDWTPVAPCREYVGRLRQAGVDAELIELPGAHHGFDVPTLPASLWLPNVQSSGRCHAVVERSPGEFVDGVTGSPAVANNPCVTRGATVGYQPAAQRAAIAGVTQFLRSTFNLPQ